MNKEDNVKWLERSTIGIPRYLITHYILIISLIAILIHVGYNIMGKYEISDGYELFRDILTIILTILGLAIAALGYGIYQFILHSVERKSEKWAIEFQDKMDIRYKSFLLYTTSLIDLNSGHSFWLEYEAKKDSTLLNHAILLTKNAYSHVQKLDTHKKRHELLKCQILNNLTYYLAERGKEGDIDLAEQYTKFFMGRIQKYPMLASNWKNTDTFIRTAIRRKKKSEKED
jgi:hypothetical protein